VVVICILLESTCCGPNASKRGLIFSVSLAARVPSLPTYTAPLIRTIAVSTGSRACFDMKLGLGSIASYHAGSQSELHRAWTFAALATSQEISGAKETYFRGGARGMDVAYGAICRNAVCGPLWRRGRRRYLWEQSSFGATLQPVWVGVRFVEFFEIVVVEVW
jgi:hypothetical protein